MGILRADRITGLGGANAIKGSTKFSEGRLLEVHATGSNADFRLRDESFTIEFWGYISSTSNSTFVGLFENNPARRSWMFEARSSQALRFEWWTDGSSGTALTSSTGAFIRDRWHHFAVVRNGTALNIYVDGTSVANTTTSDSFYENTIEPLTIGGIFQGGTLTQAITGFISNLRIIRGEAFYTANFTPPTHELTTTSNTVLLACQSSGNVFQEATGKTIIATTSAANSVSIASTTGSNTPPEASHFTPNSPVGFSTTSDVGSQYGSTFDGFGNFATSTYMVPPGGNTAQRGRGRGVFFSGNDNTTPAANAIKNNIDFIQIQSMGNTVSFGDSINAKRRRHQAAASSSTRGVNCGGFQPSSPSRVDTIEFITIATQSNSTDFGNLTQIASDIGSVSNGVRVVSAHGIDDSTFDNTIDFFTIATTGNASDFGDVASDKYGSFAALESPTRGILAGGFNNTPSPSTRYNRIDYLTIATTGNTQDFGDLTVANSGTSGSSSNTRGIIFIGNDGSSPTGNNTIDYITIASTGDAIDFGDSTGPTNAQGNAGAVSNCIKAVFAGGYGNDGSATIINTIDQVTIATTGNAVDFGDISEGTGGGANKAGCSDSHGGLTE